VTVVIPELKIYVPTWLIPAAGDAATVAPVIAHVRVVTEQLSDVTALGTTTDAEHTPASVFWLIFEGHVIAGTRLSVMVTVAAQVAELPLASVTVIITLLVPISAHVKEFLLMLSRAIPQLSVLPLSTSEATMETFPEASSAFVMFLHMGIGGVLSARVMLKVVLELLPDSSLAVMVIGCIVPAPEIIVPITGV
jgi:hypothetical protein